MAAASCCIAMGSMGDGHAQTEPFVLQSTVTPRISFAIADPTAWNGLGLSDSHHRMFQLTPVHALNQSRASASLLRHSVGSEATTPVFRLSVEQRVLMREQIRREALARASQP